MSTPSALRVAAFEEAPKELLGSSRGLPPEMARSSVRSKLPEYDTLMHLIAPRRKRELYPLLFMLLMAAKAHVSRSPLTSLLPRSLRPAFRYVECGVYRGEAMTAVGVLLLAQACRPELWGLDTFEGLPPPSATDLALAPANAPYRDANNRKFAKTSLRGVKRRLERNGLGKYSTLVKGLFADTLPSMPAGPYHFVNIDCDYYEPHIECLKFFYPRVASGGVIFFDDYYSIIYPMAKKAIENFLRDKPERLVHLRCGPEEVNHTKAFFIKE